MVPGTVVAKGVIHGKLIELDQETGIPEGQVVSVAISLSRKPADGTLPGFGAWADDSEGLDQFLKEIYEARNDDRPEPSA